MMRGYSTMPEATAATSTRDGWLHTGDLGSMDERGYLRIAGRLKDMIIRGGENIYPREVEDVLFEHPTSPRSPSSASPDAQWGEVVAAFVRHRPRLHRRRRELSRSLPRAARRATRRRRQWFFVDEFPLTPSGKVQKFALRDAWARGEHAERGG